MDSHAVLNPAISQKPRQLEPHHYRQLINGEILTHIFPHSAWGGSVSAQMYLPVERSLVWQQVTHYPSWVNYFPDIVRSEILSTSTASLRQMKRLYQVAQKAFFMFSARVEIYLQAFELLNADEPQIQFRMEKGDFNDFSADLKLQTYGSGTLLTYTVSATPTIPVPSLFIQEAMRMDLPQNLRKMRQVICSSIRNPER